MVVVRSFSLLVLLIPSISLNFYHNIMFTYSLLSFYCPIPPPMSLFLSLTHSTTLFLSLILSLCVTVVVCVCLYFCLPISFPLFPFLSVSLCHSPISSKRVLPNVLFSFSHSLSLSYHTPIYKNP